MVDTTAIGAPSLLVILLVVLTLTDQSCAFYTPTGRSETIGSGREIISNNKANRNFKPRSEIYLYGPFDGEMEMGGENEPQRQPRPRPTMDPIVETSLLCLLRQKKNDYCTILGSTWSCCQNPQEI